MNLRPALLSGLILALLSGCVAMPEKAAVETPVMVWYATDRVGNGGPGAAAVYGEGRGAAGYGVADVRLPPVHIVGTMEKPPLSRSPMLADRRWHVYLDSARPLARDVFIADLRQALDGAARRELLIYIHGFNTGFDHAMRRTAQLSHDLDYGGVAMAFSWPSAEKVTSYIADLNNADWAVADLAETLRLLIRESGADRINLIAHSMGNRVLIRALERIAIDRRAGDAPLFGEVIFAAPDVDRQIFAGAVPRLQPLAARFTLYVSDGDMALSVSKKMAGGYPRAGDSSDGLVVIPGMDTVDASAAGGDLFGHEYFGESGPVLDDIRVLLQDGAGAAERTRLTRDFERGRSYWRLLPPPAPGT